MQELKEKLRQAQQNFDYANENYLDAAIMDLNAAEERFRAMIREKKKNLSATKRNRFKKKISLYKYTTKGEKYSR